VSPPAEVLEHDPVAAERVIAQATTNVEADDENDHGYQIDEQSALESLRPRLQLRIRQTISQIQRGILLPCFDRDGLQLPSSASPAHVRKFTDIIIDS